MNVVRFIPQIVRFAYATRGDVDNGGKAFKARLPADAAFADASFAIGGTAFPALNAGAKGYVLKDRNPENIVKAVRAVAEGGTFIPDDIKAIYKARSEEPELTSAAPPECRRYSKTSESFYVKRRPDGRFQGAPRLCAGSPLKNFFLF